MTDLMPGRDTVLFISDGDVPVGVYSARCVVKGAGQSRRLYMDRPLRGWDHVNVSYADRGPGWRAVTISLDSRTTGVK